MCFNSDGQVKARSCNICGTYTVTRCLQVYNGPGELCSDGCNTCGCGLTRLVASTLACLPYDYNAC